MEIGWKDLGMAGWASRRIAAAVLVVGSLFLLSPAKAEAPKKGGKLSPEEALLVRAMTSVTAFRVAAVKNADDAAGKIMSKGAYARWKELTDKLPADVRTMCLTDFFNTCVLLMGPQKPDVGVCMLYSPFQDAVLLLQTENLGEFCQVEDFRFLSGKEFRGEPIVQDVPPETILPRDIPLTSALMKLFSASEKHFKDISAGAAPLRRYGRVSEEGFEYLKKSMVARNLCAMTLFRSENRGSLNAAAVIMEHLRLKSAEELKKKIAVGVWQEQAESFASLPAPLREGITLCHFLTSPGRSMFAFANKYYPRYVVLVSADPAHPETPWTLEWFDLAKSAALYDLYMKKQ